MSDDSAYQVRLAEISLAYKKRLPSALDTLKQLQVDLSSNTDPTSVYEDIRDVAHQLAGSAGQFQFEAVGKAADLLEAAVLRKGPAESGVEDEILAALHRLIAALNAQEDVAFSR